MQRTFEILELTPEIRSAPDAVQLPVVRGEVEFDHVTFRYFGEKNPALKDICLKVQPNQIIALIGLDRLRENHD